jgi:RimJ/RimL family protein N-acetyltransferase
VETPTIVGDRVVLQPVTPELVRAVLDGDLTDVPAGEGWPNEDTADGMRIGGTNGWVVVVDGLIVGGCGTHGDIAEDGSVEVGYGLAAPSRGQGIGTEVVALMSDWFLGAGGARTLVADVDPDNRPSWRALERAGFVRIDERTYRRRRQA